MATIADLELTIASDDNDTSNSLCKLCNDIYDYKDGPLMLPCLHSFCRKCLEKHVRAPVNTHGDGNNTLTNRYPACPCCKHPFTQRIEQLKVNLRLAHLAERKAYGKAIQNAGQLVCQVCKSNPATAFHRSNSTFLCINCQNLLLRFSVDKNQFIDLYKDFPTLVSKAKCSNHANLERELFCEDCNTMICCICAQSLDHSNHVKLFPEDAAEKYKKELAQVERALRVAKDNTERKLSLAIDHEKLIIRSKQVAIAQIDHVFNGFIDIIEKRRNNLKQQCVSICKSKTHFLSLQVKDLKSLQEKLSFAHSQANNFLKSPNPDELVSVKSELESSFERVMTYYSRQPVQLLNDYSFKFSVTNDGPLIQQINELGNFPSVTSSPCVSKCFIELHDSNRELRRDRNRRHPQFQATIAVGTTFSTHVCLRNAQNKPLVSNDYLLEYTVNRVDGCHFVPFKVIVTDVSQGRGKIEFTPDEEGKYMLIVMVQREPIGQPYTIIAKFPTHDGFNQLTKSVTHYLGPCYGIAVNDNGTVYATNQDMNCIKVSGHDGTKLADITGNQLSKPWGVALSSDGQLYVSSSGNNMIRVFSSTGKHFGGFGATGTCNGQFLTPLGLCVDKDKKLLVADYNNNRIQIFDLTGMFLKVFPCAGSPYDVAVDNDDNIYVALKDKNCVAVYKDNGTLIKSYKCSQSDHLTSSNLIQGDSYFLPTSLSFNGKYMAIGTRNKKIYVVDIARGVMKSKSVSSCIDGIAIDEDCKVYVAERDFKTICTYKPVIN